MVFNFYKKKNFEILNNNLAKHFCNIYLILFSIIISYFYTFEINNQRAITTGLILSNEVFYEDKINYLNILSHNSWTIIFQILKIAFSFKVSVFTANYLILLLTSLTLSFGIFFISSSLTKNKFFSILLQSFVLVSQINFGDLDYPTLVISEHTNGMTSSAIVILIFGLLARGKNLYAIILGIFLISIHLVVGVWVMSIIIISNIILGLKLRETFKKKEDILLLFLTFLIVIVSFVFFQINKITSPYTFDRDLYQAYLNIWDLHRSNVFNINYLYITFSFILLICLFNFKKNKSLNLFITYSSINIILSFLIYIFFKLSLYKILPNILSDIFLKIIPSRFFLLHSVIGPVIIISTIYLLMKKFFKEKYIFFSILLLLFIHPIIYYEKYINKVSNFYLNFTDKRIIDDFWIKIKNDNLNNKLILTSIDSCDPTIQISRKPILFCLESIDGIAYMNSLVSPIKDIIEDVYEIDFYNPPEKNRGGLWYDRSYKNQFEKRSKEDWYLISKKFNLGALILPKKWNLNLSKTYEGTKYNYYKF